MTIENLPISKFIEPIEASDVSSSGASGRRWLWLLPSVLLIGIWCALWAGVAQVLPIQWASWVTFLALLVAPGYLLGELITWRLRLDPLERLALAFPLSIVVLSVPGIYGLLQHWTLSELAVAWRVASALVIGLWLLHLLWTVLSRRRPLAGSGSWSADGWIMLALIGLAFAVVVPALSLYKIDGDAFAVGSFAADALAGLPLNATEPLFGTDLGPGVRMAFNQSLPMSYLWSYFSGIDAITLTATASRAMIALWTLLATYTLGKAVGYSLDGKAGTPTRFGLLLVIIQFAIFLAAPFFRGDNASIFFFERTTADKFMVPMTMLPVVFAFTLHFVRTGNAWTWLAAATASFAVSTIHPLIAAMMALALTAFALFHWLLHLRSRRTFWRSFSIAGLVIIAMLLPIVQLYISRGEAPLAPSYPSSIEGWPVGEKSVPALPFWQVPTLELYGPLPDLAQLDASEAESVNNPFLIWRFAVNSERRRLIFFDLEHYISDPNIFYEPPYLLALLLLPLLVVGVRRNLGAQFALSTTAAILFVMFNPLVTPLIGALVMPWILWRFVWLLPYALIFALALYRLLTVAARLGNRWRNRSGQQMSNPSSFGPGRYALFASALCIALVTLPFARRTLEEMELRTASPYYFPTPTGIYDFLDRQTGVNGPAVVLAEQDLSVTLPAYVARGNVVAHRMPTTSEIFPATQQTDALQRLIDQEKFFQSRYLTDESIDILQQTQAGYVIASSGSSLDIQLRLAPQWFAWQQDDQSYSLYRVIERPTSTSVVQGNSALEERLWMPAQLYFRTELTSNADSALAMVGMAEIAYSQGQFSVALNWLDSAIGAIDEPALHFRKGQLYTELGSLEEALAEFELAHGAAPHISRYSLALGDTCLNLGRMTCAENQFKAAVDHSSQPDQVSRQIALATLWQQRNQPDRAVVLYEQIAAQWPSINHQLMLALAYQDLRRYASAEELLAHLQQAHPLRTEAHILDARMKAEQGRFDESIALYRQAIRRQDLLAQASTEARLEVAQVLIEAGRLAEAQAELDEILRLEPNTPLGYSLQGDLYLRQQQPAEAMDAYLHGFRLDPTQVGIFVRLTNQLRLQGGQQEEILELLQQAIKANPYEPMLALALGDQLERRGDIDPAVDAYQTALDMFEFSSLSSTINPGGNRVSRAYAFARMAGVSEDRGRLEAAMNYYNAAVAAVPDLSWPRLLLGDALRRRGELGGATAAYERAISADPEDVNGYMRLAELSRAAADEQAARTYLSQAQEIALTQSVGQIQALEQSGQSQPPLQLALYESTSAASLTTGQALLVNASDETLTNQIALIDTGEGADALLESILTPAGLNRADATDGDSLRVLARVYEGMAGSEEAIAFYEALIARGTERGWQPSVLAEYHKELGDLYLSADRATEAVGAYTKAVSLDEWWPQPRLGLARALADLGELEIAIEQLQNLVVIAPGYVEAQVALASALETSGAGNDALEIYQQTASVHGGNVQATLALALAWQNRGDWERAESVYRETLEMNGGSAEAYVGLATLLNGQARYADAEPLLDQALLLDAQNVNAHLQKGVIAQHSGDRNGALTWFKEAIDVQAGSSQVDITLIDSLLQAGDYETALTYIQDRLVLQPDDVELILRLATVQRSLGNFTDVINTLLQAEKRNIRDHRLAAALGDLYKTEGKVQAALAAYQQALNLRPTESEYYLRVSDIWRSLGNYVRAQSVLEEGVALAQEPLPLYALMVENYIILDDTAQAEELLESARAQLGDEPDLLLALGSVYEAVDTDQADAWYDELLQSYPDNASVHMAVGDFYRETERYEEAALQLERAVALRPQNPQQHAVLARIYRATGQRALAIETYERALALAPTQIELYSEVAELYVVEDEIAKARTAFQRGMSIEPTNGRFIVAYAQFLLQQEDTDGAQTLLARAERLAPNADMLIARSEINQQLGNADAARQDLQTALEKEPGSIEAYIALSALYTEAGETDQAEQLFEQTSNRLVGISLNRP